MTKEVRESIIEDFRKHVAHSARTNGVHQDSVIVVIKHYILNRQINEQI